MTTRSLLFECDNWTTPATFAGGESCAAQAGSSDKALFKCKSLVCMFVKEGSCK